MLKTYEIPVSFAAKAETSEAALDQVREAIGMAITSLRLAPEDVTGAAADLLEDIEYEEPIIIAAE